mmetsp:Transcript_25506/g.35546  ORF Transcript_25506/g.35546 Transcript_25506/m.35546 type:complete len:336 (+) Transcript_25506:102-1109(+)
MAEEDQTNAVNRRKEGEFVRGVSKARNQISPDSKYPPESGRYHLYVAYNCPWCHRVILARAILGLEDVISMDVLFPIRSDEDDPRGQSLWKFRPSGEYKHIKLARCTKDTVLGKDYIVDIYSAAGVQGEKSVPILFDKKTKTVVNNESSEILRMMGTQFGAFTRRGSPELYPEKDSKKIDDMNEYVYHAINNGAYKAGFSSKQSVYEEAYDKYFKALEKLDGTLADSKFLCGSEMSEADVRLFPTIFRHDPIYHTRMKLTKAFIRDYPNLWRWSSDMYNSPGVADASPLDHMKTGYFGRTGNRVIPKGPEGYPSCMRSAQVPVLTKGVFTAAPRK